MSDFQGQGSVGVPQSTPVAQPANNGQGNEPSQQEGSEYSIANDFLKDIPAEHRPIIEPYIKKWDSGVTRRFQDLHNQYAPYKDLGDPDTLQQAIQVFQMLDSEDGAKQIYDLLHEQYGQQIGQPQEQNPPVGSDLQGQLPPEYLQKFDKFEQGLNTIAQFLIDQTKASQQDQEDAELDQYLGLLKNEFGEFDEDYVLTKMEMGMNGEEAVKEYQKLTQTILNQAGVQPQTPQLLPTLGGAGSVAEPPQSIKDLSSKDIRSLVANVLAKTNQEGS